MVEFTGHFGAVAAVQTIKNSTSVSIYMHSGFECSGVYVPVHLLVLTQRVGLGPQAGP